MKLAEYNIKTRQVYINLIDGELVHTETLSKKQAIEKYGQRNIVSADAPEITDGEMSSDKGITSFVLQ